MMKFTVNLIKKSKYILSRYIFIDQWQEWFLFIIAKSSTLTCKPERTNIGQQDHQID